MVFAHDLTWPELVESKVGVATRTGHLIGGPDRKAFLSDPAGLRAAWLAWQKDCQKADELYPKVQEYFQRTKHLTHPPAGDSPENNLIPSTIDYTAAKEAGVSTSPPRFTWSYSSINNFFTCPFQFAAYRYFKTVKQEDTEATLWGTRVHETGEHYLLSLLGKVYDPSKINPDDLALVKPYCDAIAASGGEVWAERKLAITQNLKPCEFFAPDAWGRGVVDIMVKKGNKITVMDYKGLALDTPLPTPTGWTTMGEVQEGDQVLGADGAPCVVVGKSQVKDLPCYELTFCDGATITCDEEHLWEVQYGESSKKHPAKAKIFSTKQLYDTPPHKLMRVRLARPLQLPEAEVPIHPYVLGCWLGDGKHSDGSITKPDMELFSLIESCGYAVGAAHGQGENTGKCPTRTVYGLRGELRKNGLLHNKHIPSAYLRTSVEQRTELLNGLFDTDGYWNPGRHQAVFVSMSEVMARQVVELLLTLGERPKLHNPEGHGFGKTFRSWVVTFTPYNISPFKLSRKAAGYKEWVSKGSRNNRIIKSIAPVRSVPTQCIKVDSADSMYLCGHHMIPTHNTGKIKDDQLQLKVFCAFLALHHPDVQEFDAKFIWLKHGKITGLDEPLTRADIAFVWQDVLNKVARVKQSWDDQVFQAMPGGLCRGWCAVKHCPHHKEK